MTQSGGPCAFRKLRAARSLVLQTVGLPAQTHEARLGFSERHKIEKLGLETDRSCRTSWLLHLCKHLQMLRLSMCCQRSWTLPEMSLSCSMRQMCQWLCV
ncbi:uncharacterized protein LOC125485000 isoform X1 [Rhincodon typus]|uniref:uncharacterized protein LOC125485000 isoform X1 n=1 Tax=Rhincodon typus TaxID=259920 RepID=UPI002030FD18|nr:uncharacterized protein LOC125485000 isoform X1 [Rhincodon typus]